MLYTIVAFFTPATVPADSPRMMHAKIYMGCAGGSVSSSEPEGRGGDGIGVIGVYILLMFSIPAAVAAVFQTLAVYDGGDIRICGDRIAERRQSRTIATVGWNHVVGLCSAGDLERWVAVSGR